VNKIRQNIVTVFLVATMLFTGNFAFAIAPLDCEMECCEANSCEIEENADSVATPVFSNDNCCVVYIEQAVEQDHAILLIAKNFNNPNYENFKIGLTILPEYKQDYIRLITHKFKTTNIYLSVSNLRI